MRVLAATFTQTILATLQDNHVKLTELCGRLEAVAETLADVCDAVEFNELADCLDRYVEEACNDEELHLFPEFSRIAGSHYAAGAINRLKLEHCRDKNGARGIAALLRLAALRSCPLPSDVFAGLLRSTSANLREHMAGEQPLLRALQAEFSTSSLA